MAESSRRTFLRRGALGLAAVGTGALALRADAQVTPHVASDHDLPPETGEIAPGARPTEPNILGPFYRTAAPFRGKIGPPLSEGTVLLVSGRVWGFDTRRPLRGAVLDLWQADTHGRYDNDDPQNPPRPDSFANRARVVTDERGYYEYETVHPGRYLNGPKFRPAHVHYRVKHPGYRELVTQLYFEGDPEIPGDPFVRKSLIIPLREVKVAGGSYEAGTFDVVLARA